MGGEIYPKTGVYPFLSKINEVQNMSVKLKLCALSFEN